MNKNGYQLITDLCESSLFRSKQAADKFSEKDQSELLMAVLLATIALSQDTKTTGWARDYAGKTAAFSNFDYFRTSGTDLYVLLHLAEESGKLDKVNARVLLRLLKGISRGNVDKGLIQQSLLRLESMLNIRDSRLKGVRRTVSNWQSSSEGERKTAIKNLMRIIQSHTRRAEVTPYLKVLTKGEPGRFGKTSSLKKAAALAGAGLAGFALGYSTHDSNKRWSIFKDDVDVDDDYDLLDEDILTEDRPTQLFNIARQLRKMPEVEQIIGVNYLSDGISAFVRTIDGNAYEFEIRPAPAAHGHEEKRGVSENVEEWHWKVEEIDEDLITEDQKNKAAKIYLTPQELEKREGDVEDGGEGREKDKDVEKNLRDLADRHNVEFVRDYSGYMKDSGSATPTGAHSHDDEDLSIFKGKNR